ncbi:MAG: hypothetical protein B6D55_02940 [Candidatus Omnitrophica bacterium 4484_70.2]|nr:MAG: hypothetical protein B6D55_02940 [Candidatus Omnitrophica bacterium 4484_70.2]
MKTTLRDEYLKNITVSENMLLELNNKIVEIINKINKTETDDQRKLWLTYIIRFDKKGKSVFTYDEAISCYKNAKIIERFIFSVDCWHSFQNKMFGKSVNIGFDILDINNCRLVVQGDDGLWVDSTYSALVDIIKKSKNLNFIAQNSFTPFLVQIAGVIIGVLLSIKGAQWLEPRLKIQYALPFAFIIVFLLFSNIWTYLYPALLRCINKLWPNITFKEKQNNLTIVIRWAMNILLGAIFLAGVKSIGSSLLNICGSLFK